MLQRFLIAILFLSTHCVFSQYDKPTDSLLNYSYEDLAKTIKDRSINDSLKTPYIETYLKKAKKDHDTIEIANGFSDLSKYAKDHNIGLAYRDSILLYTKHLNHRVYPGLGYSYKAYHNYYLGNEKVALNFYLMAYEHAKKHNNMYQINDLENTIKNLKGNYKNDSKEHIIELNSLRKKPNYKTDFREDYSIIFQT